MRATRAYLASLGTTGLLVLAAFAILITASALLTFNGWPGGEGSDRATPVLIDPGRELPPGTGPALVAAEAAGVADDVAFVAAPADGGGEDDGNTSGDGGPRDGDPDGPGDGGPEDGTPDDGAPNDPAPPGGGGGGNPPRDNGGIDLPGGGTLLPDGSVSLTDGVADGVESATDFLGADTVAQVNPELGQAVTGTGQLLTDLVRALDGTPGPARP